MVGTRVYPARAAPGEAFRVEAEFLNTGLRTWRGLGTNAIMVTYQWRSWLSGRRENDRSDALLRGM